MKGQTAVEYLMTYGWAILIILIVAGVLAYYGIFAPSGFLGQSVRGFTTVVILQPWSLSTGGTLQANMENRVGSPIELTGATLTNPTDGSLVGTGTITLPASPAPFTTAQKQIVTFDFGAISGVNVGDTFTYTLSLIYEYSGTNFTSTGTISGAFS